MAIGIVLLASSSMTVSAHWNSSHDVRKLKMLTDAIAGFDKGTITRKNTVKISLNIPQSKDRDSGRTVPRVCDRGTVLPSNDTAVISDRMRCHEFTHVQLSGIDSHRVMNDPVQDGVGNDTATEARMPFTGLVL